MQVGDEFPAFVLKDENGDDLDSRMLEGIRYVVYIYPKDSTPGCTKEALEFTDAYVKFMFRNIPVFGVSKDSVESHARFKEKNGLKVKLLSDPNHVLIEKAGAWGEKTNYGKTTMGIIRSTFIVGKDGKVEALWYYVKPVEGHAQKVLDKALSLYKS